MGGCTSQPAAEQPVLPVLTEATPEERAIASVKVIFDSIAKDGEGSASKMELINKLGPHETVRGLIKESSLNQNWGAMKDTRIEGRVTWEEFYANLTSHMPKQAIVTATAEVAADEKALEHLKKLFHTLDANADKAVSKEELAAGLAKDESIENLVKEAGFNPQYCTFTGLDDNRDGRITWEEFEAHLRSAAKEEAKPDKFFAETLEVAPVMEVQQAGSEAPKPKGLWCGC